MQAQPRLPPCAPGALTPWVAGRAARYATPGGFREAALAAGVRGDALRCGETTLRARLHMYAPGQPMARELAKNPTVLMVNDTLFAHGGVLPHHGAPRAAAAPAPGGVQCPPHCPPICSSSMLAAPHGLSVHALSLRRPGRIGAADCAVRKLQTVHSLAAHEPGCP